MSTLKSLSVSRSIARLLVRSMGLLALCGMSLLGTGAAWANAVTLSPGQTIVLPASNNATTVTCTGTGGGVTVIDHYCTCIDPGRPYMKRLNNVYVMSDGRIQEVYLGDYDDMNACNEAKNAQDACKR
jgi:hypothetical protein